MIVPPFRFCCGKYEVQRTKTPPNIRPALCENYLLDRVHKGHDMDDMEGMDASTASRLYVMVAWGMRVTEGTLPRPDLVPTNAALIDIK